MSTETGLSHTTVRRIWNAFGLQPHRAETFKLSTDPLFVDKVQDVVGLYMSPPNRAIVLCVDEKSQIQALDREQPVLPMAPGVPERRTHTYTRNGTTSRCFVHGPAGVGPDAFSVRYGNDGIRSGGGVALDRAKVAAPCGRVVGCWDPACGHDTRGVDHLSLTRQNRGHERCGGRYRGQAAVPAVGVELLEQRSDHGHVATGD